MRMERVGSYTTLTDLARRSTPRRNPRVLPDRNNPLGEPRPAPQGEVVALEGNVISRRVRTLALVGLGGLTLAVGTMPAEARPLLPRPTVQLESVAGLAPDGRSVDIGLTASCPARWTVVEA